MTTSTLESLPLDSLVTLLQSLPLSLQRKITFDQFQKFWRFSSWLKREIGLRMDSLLPPESLPVYIHDFLRDALVLDDRKTIKLWQILRTAVWSSSTQPTLSTAELELVLAHGRVGSRVDEHIGPIMLYPPSKHCLRCKKHLGRLFRHQITHFTLHGAYGGYSSSMKCDDCDIRYYPDYYVQNAFRHYYPGGVPDVFQFETHAYIESSLCEFFTAAMVYAWVSASNCANIYNSCLAQTLTHPPSWTCVFRLNTEQVWNAFYLKSLLKDTSKRDIILKLSNVGTHADRLKNAMVSRNTRLSQYGLPQRMHACNKCEVVDRRTNLPVRAVVTDGITLGRPCCAQHNCTKALVNNRFRFCEEHQDKLGNLCAVEGCNERRVSKSLMCSETEHQEWESRYNSGKKAWFQLRARLAQAGVPQLLDSLPDDAGPSDIGMSSETDPSHKLDEGNVQIKVRLARRRTHNEQLVVCCCGVIAARGTMYGAEAVSGVKDFLKSVYLFDANQLPSVIFYDNNCQLQGHLQASGDTFFKNTILPVDVFHFKSKHKITDSFCQKNCNPAQWKELADDEGNWIFNSSAAEQANVWMGGYLSIVREMLPHNFDFFLDEMIMWRNEKLIERQKANGHAPYLIPV